MKRALLTFGIDRCAPLLAITRPYMEAYAKRHGYRFMLGDGQNDEGRPPAWSKIPLLLATLETCSACLWLDADVFIAKMGKDCADDVPDWAGQGLVIHNTAQGEVPNTGVWYIKRSMRPFLQLMWELEVFTNHAWWEQGAAMLLMGYNVRPDSAGWAHERLLETRWSKLTAWLPLEWNARPADYCATTRFHHITCSWPVRLPVLQGLASAFPLGAQP